METIEGVEPVEGHEHMLGPTITVFMGEGASGAGPRQGRRATKDGG